MNLPPRISWLCLTFFCLTSFASAQTAAPSATPTTKPAEPAPANPTPDGASQLRLVPDSAPSATPSALPSATGVPPRVPPKAGDPTIPGPAIRELLGQGEAKPAQAQQPTPGVPLVRLRARLALRNKPAVAVVEIDGRMYHVRPGDEFSVPIDGAPTPLRVVKLTATEMQLEIVNRRAVINLN